MLNQIIGMPPEFVLNHAEQTGWLPQGVRSIEQLRSMLPLSTRGAARAAEAIRDYEACRRAAGIAPGDRGFRVRQLTGKPRRTARRDWRSSAADRRRLLEQRRQGLETANREARHADPDTRSTAAHEAGHMLTALALGADAEATIEPIDGAAGRCWFELNKLRSPLHRAAVATGGAVAEAKHATGEYSSWRQFVSQPDRDLAGDDPRTFYEGASLARRILQRNRAAFEMLQLRLLHSESVDAATASRVVSTYLVSFR